MNRWRWALLLALGAPLAATAFPPLPKPKENKAAEKDLAKAMAGTWEVISLERGGVKGKGNPSPYHMVLTRDGQKLTRSLVFKDANREGPPATILLNTSKKPAWFDVHTQDAPTSRISMNGIVKVDGDKMIWVSVTGTAERPKSLEGDLGIGQYRYTFKRVKKP